MPLRLGQEIQALLRGNLTPRQRRLPSALTEMLNSPDLRSRVHIFALQIPAVRLLAGATLFLSAARRLRPRYFHDISTFRLFEKKLIEAGVKMEQSTGFEANASADSDVAASKSLETGLAAAAVRAILNDETLSADRRVAVYNSIVWNITRLDRLSVSYPEFADRYRPWRIAVPTDMLQPIKRRLQHRAQSERIARRESTCAVAATDPIVLKKSVLRCVPPIFGNNDADGPRPANH